MLKNYLKTALRNIYRNKLYSFINIFSLSIGISIFVLVVLYIQFEFSYDKYHKNGDRIYRVIQSNSDSKEKTSATTPPALGPILRDELSGVELSTRIGVLKKILVNVGQKNFMEPEIHCIGNDTFNIFSIPFLHGDNNTALLEPSSIILSSSVAKKYFNREDPIGEIITIGEKYKFKVTGIYKDMPKNSHFQMGIAIPFKSYFQFKFGPAQLFSWDEFASFYTYILLGSGTDLKGVEENITSILNKHIYKNPNNLENKKIHLWLQPLHSIHLLSKAEVEISSNNSDILRVYLFLSIAVLILIVACINYMNLAIALFNKRSKEVGLRKVVGAQKNQLVQQFLSESLLFSLLSFIPAVILIFLTIPLFNYFLEIELTFNLLINFKTTLFIFSTMVLIGLFAGGYPSFYISALKPVSILKKVNTRSKVFTLRNFLVTAQFSVSIIMIICTIIVNSQLDFINNKDMGYDKEQIVVIHTGDKSSRKDFHSKLETIKSELLKNKNIVSVSGSKRLPNNVDFNPIRMLPSKTPGINESTYAIWADKDFTDLYGIKLTSGKNFSNKDLNKKKGEILINETAAKILKWENPLGRTLTYWGNRKGKIVGIMKDFHFQSLQKQISPLCIYFEPESFDYLSVKIKPSEIPEAISYIKKTLKTFSPKHPFEYSFFDELFNKTYKAEEKLSSLFNYFSIISIIIACIGLFGLASFSIDQRIKEIGIRKILGASSFKLIKILSFDFARWVIISCFIAFPIAFFFMNNWLQNYSYRTDISALSFIFAGFISFVIAIFTVSFKSVKVALSNPVKSLKYD